MPSRDQASGNGAATLINGRPRLPPHSHAVLRLDPCDLTHLGASGSHPLRAMEKELLAVNEAVGRLGMQTYLPHLDNVAGNVASAPHIITLGRPQTPFLFFYTTCMVDRWHDRLPVSSHGNEFCSMTPLTDLRAPPPSLRCSLLACFQAYAEPRHVEQAQVRLSKVQVACSRWLAHHCSDSSVIVWVYAQQ